MRPWAQWCVDHNLRWLLILGLFLVSPIYFAIGAFRSVSETWTELGYEYDSVMNQPRSKR